MKAFPRLALLFICCLALDSHGDDYAVRRHMLMEEVAAMADHLSASSGFTSFSPKVKEAMEKVERHRFVPGDQVANAYENRPLPIGYGQTISQPYIVALMTELLKVSSSDKVLEIGTGSGYQAAILAHLVQSVYTLEIVEPLGKQAQTRLKSLGYTNVFVKIADGYYGWPDAAQFDAIIVTAAASHVPPPLIKQLKPGGRMVIPLGTQFHTQFLMLVEKKANGTVTSRQILPVAFVPLTGAH